jgi:hypothetical protein
MGSANNRIDDNPGRFIAEQIHRSEKLFSFVVG